MQELIQMQSCPLGNKDSRPLVGGFSATAYEAMKEFHYSTNLVAMPVKEENSNGGGEEEEKKTGGECCASSGTKRGTRIGSVTLNIYK